MSVFGFLVGKWNPSTQCVENGESFITREFIEHNQSIPMMRIWKMYIDHTERGAMD